MHESRPTGLPPIDIADASQNAFVQCWLSLYRNAFHNSDTESGAFEVVIEAVQETYSPYTTGRWDNEA